MVYQDSPELTEGNLSEESFPMCPLFKDFSFTINTSVLLSVLKPVDIYKLVFRLTSEINTEAFEGSFINFREDYR